MSAGARHTAAILSDGTLWAWGYNNFGQLGDGTTTDQYAPVQIGSATNWATVSAGTEVTAAVRADDTLWEWGSGLLGNGPSSTALSPTQVGTGTNWRSVTTTGGGFSGDHATIAIRTDGTLWTWGDNNSGQLGDGTTSGTHEAPEQIGTATSWAAAGFGHYHAVALRTDGTLWAWGDNADGELGDGTTTNKTSPTQIGAATNWSLVSAGGHHTEALRTGS